MAPFWKPDLNANRLGLQWKVFNSRARCLLVAGPRLSAKCVDSSTIVHCNGSFKSIGSLGDGLLPGESRPAKLMLQVFDADTRKIAYSEATEIYRDPAEFGFEIAVNYGGSIKCSEWHPLWAKTELSEGWTTSKEIKDAIEFGMEVWLARFDPGQDIAWAKVVSVKICSVSLFDFCVPRHHNFIGNGFVNHNTWATLHRIVRHMWETPRARVAMFSKTMKNSKEGGTWLDMHGTILKEWIDANIGLKYTSLNSESQPGWKVIGDTRTPYFSIINAHGGVSDCRLFSLDHVPDVVDKVKEQRFSMIYFSELMKFEDQVVLSATTPCLRMPHLRYEDHMWLADTNPAEEGDQSWIYQVWYKERVQSYEDYCEDCLSRGIEPQPIDDWKIVVSGLELIEMFPEDNERLDRRQLIELKERCKHDPGLYDRDVRGKWVYGDGDKSRHFRAFFKPEIHVVGSIEFPDEDDYEVIKPSPNSVDLVTGLDPGDTNHAGVIMDRRYIGGRKHFDVLEELESVGKKVKMEDFANGKGDWVSLEDFTIALMALIEEIERDAGRTFDLSPSYSDASALEKYSATGNTFPALEVLEASKGRLTLIGVPKPHGSIQTRVNLLKKLLSQGRFHVSAQCVAVQRMLRDLKKGKGLLNYVVNDENKHIFDAVTYPIIAECAEEILTQEDRITSGKRQQSNGVIHL